MVDENFIVFVCDLKLFLFDDFDGLKFGGILGYVYKWFGFVIENGWVCWEDVFDYISNLKKLCLGWVDFVIISRLELVGI